MEDKSKHTLDCPLVAELIANMDQEINVKGFAIISENGKVIVNNKNCE